MRTGKQQAGRTTSVPYGLDDQAHADVVRRLFQEFTDPYRRPSLAELAQALNVDGIPTRRGGMWYASTLDYLLRNPAYVDGRIVDLDTWQAAQRRLAQLRPGPAR